MSNSSSGGRSSKGLVGRAAGAVTADLARCDMLSNELQIMEKESLTTEGMNY